MGSHRLTVRMRVLSIVIQYKRVLTAFHSLCLPLLFDLDDLVETVIDHLLQGGAELNVVDLKTKKTKSLDELN